MFSVGIVFLAADVGAAAGRFGGITDRLIPLFAIGAFLAFTLSQAGMVVHWWRGAADAAGSGTRGTCSVNGARRRRPPASRWW